jgi:EAL domain-containing protein (putative c-di-GMP-specific phosphodiesterase class I)
MAAKQRDLQNLIVPSFEDAFTKVSAFGEVKNSNVINFAKAKRLKLAMIGKKKPNPQQTGLADFIDSSLKADINTRLTSAKSDWDENMVNQIEAALEQDRFILHYQPQYNTDNRHIVGMEALLRMQSSQGEMIRPDLFIPVAEQHDLIIPIGNWVIHHTCQQLRQWQDAGYQSIRMAINVSPKQLTDDAIIDVISQAVNEAGIEYSDLELEITEQCLISNMEVAVKVLNELSQKGVRIALDDFGTGYSAFLYLCQLPIDVIKIDRAFIADSASDKKARLVIQGIVNIAKSLGMEVVAEGVETEQQQQFIAQVGCDIGQGFGFAQPTDANGIESTWLAMA